MRPQLLFELFHLLIDRILVLRRTEFTGFQSLSISSLSEYTEGSGAFSSSDALTGLIIRNDTYIHIIQEQQAAAVDVLENVL